MSIFPAVFRTARRTGAATLLALALCFALPTVPAAASPALDISPSIEAMLADGDGIEWCFSCPTDGYPEELADIYAARNFRPVWVSEGKPSDTSRQAILMLKHSYRHGLYPEDYRAHTLEALALHLIAKATASEVGIPNPPEHLAAFDLLLSRSFALFAEHLLNGRTNPGQLEEIWVRQREDLDMGAIFTRLDNGGDMLAEELALLPRSGEYLELMQEADVLRLFVDNSGWTPLPEPENTRMEPGQAESPFVPELRERFIRLGLLMDYSVDDDSVYDETLVEAIRGFQIMHGLDPDGIIGDQTRAALNLSDLDRYRKLLVNMERWRWLPRSWEGKTILVNIPSYRLRALRDGVQDLEMKIIVGTYDNQTPVFSKPMRYIETNPYWNVPESIALDELLPKIRNNQDYLAKHNYELVDIRHNPGQVLEPETLNWSDKDVLSGVRIRQVPGGWNALGVIKFMFPNRFDVYLHDTSQRHLFDRINRNLSHGCIRVHDPMSLALFVMGDDPSWTRERIQALLDSGKREQVSIPTPLTVHIMYLTAEPFGDGRIRLYRDIYDLDDDVWALLEAARPEMEESFSSIIDRVTAL